MKISYEKAKEMAEKSLTPAEALKIVFKFKYDTENSITPYNTLTDAFRFSRNTESRILDSYKKGLIWDYECDFLLDYFCKS